ncbi:MAG TPA: hypothetical protein VGI69_03060 [Gaiellaceae bacterium]|jgi:hypothetical protein
MEARLTLRRLLAIAAIAGAVAVTSGCGGGSDAQAAAKQGPPRVEYSNALLSFSHPAAWKAHPFTWAGSLHFRPLVYLSTQPLHDPCSTKGNTTSCGFPVDQLDPGGALVTWNASSPPATGLGPGPRIRVGGRPARRVDTPGGMCRRIGGDRTIDVLIQTRPFPSTPTEFTACLRGPGLAQAEKNVDALLASTKFLSQ